MIKSTDKVKFRVKYKEHNILKTVECDTFAAAAGTASALNGITRLIDIEVTGVDSSWTAPLYVYSSIDNTRIKISAYAINALKNWSLK